jgi:NADPH-dependent 2,4-dienoyl-CoA reductase/sulfur reductase-like enzyme
MLQHEPSQDNGIGESAVFIELFVIECDGVKRAVGRDPSLHYINKNKDLVSILYWVFAYSCG